MVPDRHQIDGGGLVGSPPMKNNTNDVALGLSSRRRDEDAHVEGGLALTNLGRARETTEGYVYYLDRLAAEDAA